MRKPFLILAALALVVSGASPALAAADEPKDRVVVSGDVVVTEGEIVGDIVIFDGSVEVEGHVHGSVVAFSGPVRISGTVTDSVIAFDGVATIEDGATVQGDVFSTRDPIVESGATVEGEAARWDIGMFGGIYDVVSHLMFWLAGTVSTLILGLFMVFFAPRALDSARRLSEERRASVIGMGLAVFFGLPMLALGIMVTLVGVPLGLAIVLALALIYPIGYVTSTTLLGAAIRPTSERAVSFIIGWTILRLIALVPFVGGLVWTAASIFGLGALTVAAWRARSPMAAPPVPAAG